jgi:hypothetical protein
MFNPEEKQEATANDEAYNSVIMLPGVNFGWTFKQKEAKEIMEKLTRQFREAMRGVI